MSKLEKFGFILTLAFGVCLLVGVLFLYYQSSLAESVEINYNEENLIVEIDGQLIEVTLADTPKLREQGLSGTTNLPTNSGMLFVFPYSDNWGIWMKDMNYALDILWIDRLGRIVHLKENVTPESFPHTYQPTKPALYVLELSAGFIENNNISTASSISLPESL